MVFVFIVVCNLNKIILSLLKTAPSSSDTLNINHADFSITFLFLEGLQILRVEIFENVDAGGLASLTLLHHSQNRFVDVFNIFLILAEF